MEEFIIILIYLGNPLLQYYDDGPPQDILTLCEHCGRQLNVVGNSLIEMSLSCSVNSVLSFRCAKCAVNKILPRRITNTGKDRVKHNL
jgi:hypothetical protein